MAKKIKKDTREDLFAATPSLEAKRMLFSLWASMPGMCLDFGDVARTYFHAKARRKVYVDLPAEDFEEGMRGRRRTNWEMKYTEMMLEAMSEQGVSMRMCSTTRRRT